MPHHICLEASVTDGPDFLRSKRLNRYQIFGKQHESDGSNGSTDPRTS
jgi:hypothetical protein